MAHSPAGQDTTGAKAADATTKIDTRIQGTPVRFVEVTPPGPADATKNHGVSLNGGEPITWTSADVFSLEIPSNTPADRWIHDVTVTHGAAASDYTVRWRA